MKVITHKKGDSFNSIIRVRTKTVDPDTGAVTYEPINITGATIWFTIKRQESDPDVAVEADPDNSILAQNGALLLKEIGPTEHTAPYANGLSNTNCSAEDMDFAVNEVGEKYFAEFQIKDSAGNIMSSETFAWKQLQDLVQVDE